MRLEAQNLFELGQLTRPAAEVFDALAAVIGLRMSDVPFFAVAREAEQQTWTRDPFDRLIVTQASLEGAGLVTKDAAMHAAYARAIW